MKVRKMAKVCGELLFTIFEKDEVRNQEKASVHRGLSQSLLLAHVAIGNLESTLQILYILHKSVQNSEERGLYIPAGCSGPMCADGSNLSLQTIYFLKADVFHHVITMAIFIRKIRKKFAED